MRIIAAGGRRPAGWVQRSARAPYLHALQGQHALALELHQRNLADHEHVHGPDHPHTVTITARSNLAYAYQLAGDLPRAIELHAQVLADRERLYGAEHHYTQIARQLLTTAEHQASERAPVIDTDDRRRAE